MEPLFRLTPLTTGAAGTANVNRSAELAAEVPEEVVTLTSTAPAEAEGTKARIKSSDTTE
jgi:hypothetical protein